MKAGGYTGSEEQRVIFKCDGERAIGKVRTALARGLGGRVVPEDQPKVEKQCNGVVEEPGRTICCSRTKSKRRAISS